MHFASAPLAGGHVHLRLADDLVDRICRPAADDCRLWASESQPRNAGDGGQELAFIAESVWAESVDAASTTDANTNLATRRTISSEKDMGNAIQTSRQILHSGL